MAKQKKKVRQPEKPTKLPTQMKFDEVMERIVKVKPPKDKTPH